MKTYAIITGDIVSSKKIKPPTREILYGDINGLLKELKKKWITSFETYRGDSLQCAARMPELALRIALIIRSYLKAYTPGEQKKKMTKAAKPSPTRGYFKPEFDIRLGIGVGQADFIRPNKISSSDGEAFRFSGEALDNLQQGTQRLALKTNNVSFNEQAEPAILLLDALIGKWTQNQAEFVLYKLQHKKEDEIAKLLKISQSAVNQRKKTAQWFAVEKLIDHFEKTVKSWTI